MIIEANYDEVEGVGMITKSGKYGTYTAFSRVHADDADLANYWDGLAIAEYKADVMIQQEKAKMYRQRAEGANMVLQYLDLCGVGADDPVYRKVARYVGIMARDYHAEYKKFQAGKSKFPDFVDMLHADRKLYNEKVEKHNAQKMEG